MIYSMSVAIRSESAYIGRASFLFLAQETGQYRTSTTTRHACDECYLVTPHNQCDVRAVGSWWSLLEQPYDPPYLANNISSQHTCHAVQSPTVVTKEKEPFSSMRGHMSIWGRTKHWWLIIIATLHGCTRVKCNVLHPSITVVHCLTEKASSVQIRGTKAKDTMNRVRFEKKKKKRGW